MTNKEKYIEFCKKEKNIPIFSKDWWLDCVCGEKNWDVALVEKGGQVVASMPYFLKKKFILNIITMPKLTQNMGPFIKYPKGQKYYKRLSWEKDIISKLLEQIPNVDFFIQNFHYSIVNWLPLYWQGFKQTTNYTYVIEDIDIRDLEKNFETDIRRRRRRKAYEAGVEVIESDDIKIFYELNTMTFIRQGMNIPYTFDFVKKLYEACKKNNAIKMYFAKYEDNVIACNFLVYDDNTVYYLMGGIHPDFKDLGGMDIVQFESIRFALESGKIFDFEGSMIESIEKYFRSFGAIQKPYYQITKTTSKLLKLRNFINELKND